MNHKLVESYIKDHMRKAYKQTKIFSENGILYISTLLEVCFQNRIVIYGYKTGQTLYLDYPKKNGYEEETLDYIVLVINAQVMLEAVYDNYKEVI